MPSIEDLAKMKAMQSKYRQDNIQDIERVFGGGQRPASNLQSPEPVAAAAPPEPSLAEKLGGSFNREFQRRNLAKELLKQKK